MRLTTKFWAKVLATAAPPLLALGGCSVVAGSGASPVEARAELYDVLDETQELVGGSWDNQDDPTARGCVIPIWVDGEKYPALRIGSPPDDPQVALAAIVDAWDEWGFTVEKMIVGDVNELQAHNSYNELLIFRVSDDAMTLQGESECRPSER